MGKGPMSERALFEALRKASLRSNKVYLVDQLFARAVTRYIIHHCEDLHKAAEQIVGYDRNAE